MIFLRITPTISRCTKDCRAANFRPRRSFVCAIIAGPETFASSRISWQRLFILGTGEQIEGAEISAATGMRAPIETNAIHPEFELPLREARERFEKAYLEYQLQSFDGSVSKVAERVGIERTHLYRKLRSLGIDPKQIKEASRE